MGITVQGSGHWLPSEPLQMFFDKGHAWKLTGGIASEWPHLYSTHASLISLWQIVQEKTYQCSPGRSSVNLRITLIVALLSVIWVLLRNEIGMRRNRRK